MNPCSDCGKPTKPLRRGRCQRCYDLARGHLKLSTPTFHEKILLRIRRTASCWEWTGAKTPLGYGMFSVCRGSKTKTYNAYRLVYQMFRGEIPKDLELDHLCRNSNCVNPDHLEPVSHLENVRRGIRARKFLLGKHG